MRTLEFAIWERAQTSALRRHCSHLLTQFLVAGRFDSAAGAFEVAGDLIEVTGTVIIWTHPAIYLAVRCSHPLMIRGATVPGQPGTRETHI